MSRSTRLKVVPSTPGRRRRPVTLLAMKRGRASSWSPQQMLDHVRCTVMAKRPLKEAVVAYWTEDGTIAWWAAGAGAGAIVHLLEAAKLSILLGTE